MSSVFEWTKKREEAALSLAQGATQAEAAEIAGVSDRTIRNWLNAPEFSEEVDRLTLMTGIANRAERLRVVKRIIKQRVKDGEFILSEKDLLDWLKYAQSETDGVKLDMVGLIDAYRNETQDP